MPDRKPEFFIRETNMKLQGNFSSSNLDKKIFDYYETKAEPARAHLGASMLGRPCDRELWLSFRWAVSPNVDGRMLKLFKRGHLEELIIINDLKAIGLTIDNSQDRVEFCSHVSGSVDGVALGVPEAPQKKHVLECKTSSLKNFEKMLKEGCEKAKPEHFVQMHLYMHGLKFDSALYVVVCKDDDRMYFERIKYNKEIAEKAIERGRRIVNAPSMPEPIIGASPEWYQCKFCSCFDFCHKSHKTKNVNCRTCAHSTPVENNQWTCELYSCDISLDDSRNGCPSHVLHPDLVPWTVDVEKTTPTNAAYTIDGKTVLNGSDGISSKILVEDDVVQKICKIFKGEVVNEI
jgi:hypothetical protein